MTTSSQDTGAVLKPWPEYDHDIPETFDAYMRDLVGWDHADRWARLPATFRWHELWERIGKTIATRTPENR